MSKVSFPLSGFREKAKIRPSGYADHVLEYAEVIGDRVWIEADDLTYLTHYYDEWSLPEPRMTEKISTFGKAMGRWMDSGFEIADGKEVSRRKEICTMCPKWDKGARLGLGKCTHNACGCTKLKWWLKGEKCPADLW
tara:strand:+ start:209 stop:619 length:411 start_codon:yes stop_codon:yes gene_type:complete